MYICPSNLVTSGELTMTKRTSLDGRYRDLDGEIRQKNGNTRIETLRKTYGEDFARWPAPGFTDTELGVLMEPEVDHGEAEVYARVQA